MSLVTLPLPKVMARNHDFLHCKASGSLPILPSMTDMGAMQAMCLIKLQTISKYYKLGTTTVRALQDVDLRVDQGEFTAVWGPSGSGKSTLFNVLATIDRPSKGSYTFAGQDVTRLGDQELTRLRQQRIGIIFQSFNLVPVLSALENVTLPLQFGRSNKKQLNERARYLLEEVGLADQQHQRPNQLSGGQQQRVAIARALIAEPSLVLADEPTANLDSKTSELIINLLARLNRDHGTTFLFSTHHDLLIQSARRQLHLKDGLLETEAAQSGKPLPDTQEATS